MDGFFARFSELEDPRDGNARHDLLELLVIALCAVLCGAGFYAGGGAFMFTQGDGEYAGERGRSVWIGAKTEHPLQCLKPYIDDSWDYVAV